MVNAMAFKVIILVVLVLTGSFHSLEITIVSGISGIDQVQVQDKQQYEENKNRSNSFLCGPPQPRAQYAIDILKENRVYLSACEVIDPVMVVVHRCDFASGCCVDQKGCQPHNTEEQPLVFQITRHFYGVNSNCPEPYQQRYETVEFSNHTLCSCQTNETKIK